MTTDESALLTVSIFPRFPTKIKNAQKVSRRSQSTSANIFLSVKAKQTITAARHTKTFTSLRTVRIHIANRIRYSTKFLLQDALKDA